MTANPLEAHPDLTYEHQPELDLRHIDLIASVTNQSRFEPINQPTVDRYVAALTEGATFPPIIVRRVRTTKGQEQLVVLGGNHRVRAHIDHGAETIDAFIVECDDLTALEVAYRDNATHGLPPSDEERITHALTLVDKGRTVAEAARTVGLPEQRLYHHRAAQGVAKRAARLGVTVELQQTGISIRARFAGIRDDRVFTKVIRTIAAERLGQVASQRLITDVNSQGSIAEAMDIINVYVQEHRATVAGRSNGSTNPYVQLRAALGQIRGLNPSETVERITTQRDRDDLHERLLAGARHLMAIDQLLDADDKPNRRAASRRTR